MKRIKQNSILFFVLFCAVQFTVGQTNDHLKSDSILSTSKTLMKSEREQAEELESKEPFRLKHNLGVATGFTTGWGLAYRYFPGKLGYQVNMIGYKDVDKGDLSIGGTLLYSLYTNYYSNLYLYQANSYYYKYPAYAYGGLLTPNTFNQGFGFGIELIAAKYLSFNLMLGYGALRNWTVISPTVEVALFYKFNK